MSSKTCEVCGIQFFKKQNCSKKSWSKSRFCSLKCCVIGVRDNLNWKGRHHSAKSKKLISLHKKGQVAWNTGIKNCFSRETIKNMSDKHRLLVREKSPRWKGGITKSTQGYIKIKNRDHLLSNANGYVNRSVLVAEKYLGRPLIKGEVIHHINEIKEDDRPSNLFLFPSNSAHAKYHNDLRNNRTIKITISNIF